MKKKSLSLLFFALAVNTLLAQWQTVITPNTDLVNLIDGENKVLFFKSPLAEFISTDEGKTWTTTANLQTSGACNNQDSILFVNGNGFQLKNNMLLKTCSFTPLSSAVYETEYNNELYFQKKPANSKYGTISTSDNNTKTWTEFLLPANEKGFQSILFAEKKKLVAALFDIGPDSQFKFNIYYSDNQGVMWSNLLYVVSTYSGGSGQKLNSLFLLNDEIVIVGENGGVMTFVNYITKAVHKTSTNIIGSPTKFNRAVQRNDILFAQINSKNVYYSTDKGTTWSNITDNLPNATIGALNIVNNKLYASVNGQVYVRNIGPLSSEKNTVTLNDDLFVFPNPSTNEIHIQLKNNDLENYSVEIFDIFGKKILQQKSNLDINISTFSKGFYFLKMSQNGKYWMKKFEKI
jgi:hypothetical protein